MRTQLLVLITVKGPRYGMFVSVSPSTPDLRRSFDLRKSLQALWTKRVT